MKRFESRKSLLGKLHIAKKDLGMDDESYNAFKRRVVGKESAKDFTLPELVRAVAECRRLGWMPTGEPKPAGKSAGKPAKGKAPLMGKITALLAEAERPEAYADAMAKRMYKRDALAFCAPAELQGIVAALVKDAKRHGRQV